jgi:radical SAM superfamily enzyme YgiQ (UPF0313 family)
MKILLILAHTGTTYHVVDELIYRYYYPSLTLGQLVSITPDHHKIEVIDGRYQKVDYNWVGDIVGISCRTVAAKTAYKIADKFREKGIKVVLGGWHPSLMPEEAKQHADSVVIGEAEDTWPQLLRDFENGELKSFYRQTKPVDPRSIPSPEIIKQKHIFCMPIQATRGCPYGCSFCPVSTFQGKKIRLRPIDDILKEIKDAPTKRLYFVDNSLTINVSYTKELFREMIGLNKKFSCYGNINVLGEDIELLKLSADAGCDCWIVGFESIYQETINKIGKITNVVEKYPKAIKKMHDHNLIIQGLFVFGLDDDKPSVFRETLKAIYKWKLDKAGFAIRTPFPGTTEFDKLDSQGMIISKDWSKYNLKNVVFQPKNMNPVELFKGTNWAINNFYSNTNLIKRNIQDKEINLNRIINRTISEALSKNLYKILGF